jgi:hypothetical protein
MSSDCIDLTMGKIKTQRRRLQPYVRVIAGKKVWFNGYATRISAASAMRILNRLRARGLRLSSNAVARKQALALAKKGKSSKKASKRKASKKRSAYKKKSATKKRTSTKKRVSSKRKSATKKRKSTKRKSLKKKPSSGERQSGRRNMRKFDYRRPSPALSATRFVAGTKKRGNDGNMWVIKIASNGIRRWVKM